MATRSRIQNLGLALGLAACGCQGTPRERYAFPATWPGSQPLRPDAPIVQVIPIQIPSDRAGLPPPQSADSAAAAPGAGLPTAAVLSALFVKYLHVNGVNAILEEPKTGAAAYALECTVPRLGYERAGSYPKTTTYHAEMTCALLETVSGQAVWQRSLTQAYDTTRLVNLMTRLPPSAHEDERILYRECIVPLWDAMAQSVGVVVLNHQRATGAPARPAS